MGMMHHSQFRNDARHFHGNILLSSNQFDKPTKIASVFNKPSTIHTVGWSHSAFSVDNACSIMTNKLKNVSLKKPQSSSILTKCLFQENHFNAPSIVAISNTIKTTEILSEKQTRNDDAYTSKEKIQPLRPLSAYNYFFRDERERILRQSGDHDHNHDMTSDNYPYTEMQQLVILREHWSQDRTQKRRHRKTHGKISFTALSKLVSQRWKVLPPEQKEFYQHVVSKDWKRYQEELKHFSRSVQLKLC
jgi:HMG (high mobility group) box